MASYYTYLKKNPGGKGISQVFTNLNSIVEFDEDMKYHTLMRVFGKEKLTWWEDSYKSVMIIKSFNLQRGKQRFKKAVTDDARNFK